MAEGKGGVRGGGRNDEAIKDNSYLQVCDVLISQELNIIIISGNDV